MLFMWTRLLRKHSATAAGWHRYKRRSTTTAPRDLQDRVQEHTSSRSFDRVQEGGALAHCSPQGRCHVPHVFSWGGRRALNALVGGVGTPAQAPFVSPLLVGTSRDLTSRGGGRP